MFLFPDWVFPGWYILRHPGLVGTCPDRCWMVTGEGRTPAVHQSLPQGDETMWGCHWYTACLYCPYQHLQFALLQVVISDLLVILLLWQWPLEAPPVSNFSWKVVKFVYSLLCMVTSKCCYHSNKLTVPSVYWIGGIDHFVSLFLLLLSVSEAPRAAPAAKKFPSYNPQYKTDEEKKEEVRDVIESLQSLSRPCNISMFATPQWLHYHLPIKFSW